MKTQTKLLFILLPAFGVAIPYLPCAFYHLTFNPFYWSEIARMETAVLGTLFMLCGVGLAAFLNSKK